MSLHDTTEIAKKVGLVLGIGLGIFFFVIVTIKVSGFIHAILFPPKIAPPNQAYGKLPPIEFPKGVDQQFSYSINTVNGSLPQDFPDRLVVYPMIINQPSLLNLDNAKQVISNLQFDDAGGNPIAPVSMGGSTYEWKETSPDTNGFNNIMNYDIVSQNFIMTSNYLTQLSVLQAQFIQDLNYSTDAIPTVLGFLTSLNAVPTDVDTTLTQSPAANDTYTTTPLLYSITNGQLTPTTALANAQVIRVDLYQKEIDYSLTAGQGQDLTQFQTFDMKLPVMYPHPPYSTMNFLVASGLNGAAVVQADFTHQSPDMSSTKQATYPIKTAQQAYDELKSGKGYIAAYNGTGSQIQINNVFLAYYIGGTQQQYLIPVIVFEGQDGFFAYVNAVTDAGMQ